MLLSFKTALIPNNRQITAFRKASGVARHAYNWANAQITVRNGKFYRDTRISHQNPQTFIKSGLWVFTLHQKSTS
jgi:hypothetical protein